MNTKEVSEALGISVQAVVKKFTKHYDELQPYLAMKENGQYDFDQNGLEKLRQVGQRKRLKQESPTEKIVKTKNLEISELEKKIQKLSERVNDLEVENEKLRDRNDILFNTNTELTKLNTDLSLRISQQSEPSGFFRRLIGLKK